MGINIEAYCQVFNLFTSTTQTTNHDFDTEVDRHSRKLFYTIMERSISFPYELIVTAASFHAMSNSEKNLH